MIRMNNKGKMVVALMILVILLSAVTNSFAVADGETIEQKLSELLEQYPAGSIWNSEFDGASQCYGFAKMIVYNLFGKSTVSGKSYRSWLYNGESTSGMEIVGQVASCTEATVADLLLNAKPGDVLQFDTGNTSGHQHSMIVYAVDGAAVTIYDCNWSSTTNNIVNLTNLTAQGLANRQVRADGSKRGTLSLLRSDNYESLYPSTPTYV